MKSITSTGLILIPATLVLTAAGCSIFTNYYTRPDHKDDKKTKQETGRKQHAFKVVFNTDIQ